MTWNHYRLRFRLLGPLHIGYRKVGNLMETRRYVPGKNLWAALTARLTRDFHDGSRGSEYRRVGNLVRDHFRFGYLWPSPDGEQPYFPQKHENDFDYLFLGGYTGAALDYDRQATLEGQLRETEFIAPHTRKGRPVYLLGDLWVRDDLPAKVEKWQEALGRVSLGGERGYGWGRVRLDGELHRSDGEKRPSAALSGTRKGAQSLSPCPPGDASPPMPSPPGREPSPVSSGR